MVRVQVEATQEEIAPAAAPLSVCCGTQQTTPRRTAFAAICEMSSSLFGHVLAWFALPNIFSSFCFRMTSAGERPWRPSGEWDQEQW